MRTALQTLAAVLAILWPGAALAQESRFASDLRREREHIAESCGEFAAKAFVGCAYTLATDYPFHLALGSIAPQNGFALGLAFVERYTPNEFWRISWNADAVRSFGGSWRAGAYMKIIHTPETEIVVRTAGAEPPSSALAIREHPVLNVYAQTISLEKQAYFGLGNFTSEEGESAFSQRQTIVGTNLIWPLPAPGWAQALRPSLVAGANGRFIRIRGNASEPVPSIDALYDDATAPGLSSQPAFLQLEEGVRLKPSTPNGALRFNYLVSFQQFLADRDERSSFRRWTLDLKHEIPLYRRVASPEARDTNGPNECFTAVGSNTCPAISYSRNRGGAVNLRLLATSSSPLSESRVPFYFQPTLGGSDVNGQRMLAAFNDYRFRGPHLIALQESLEHSIWGPLGVYVLAEQGKVTQDRGDLDFAHLKNSYAIGLTVRAGGLPMINLSFAWGSEGNHLIATMDTSLLGGSARPSLY